MLAKQRRGIGGSKGFLTLISCYPVPLPLVTHTPQTGSTKHFYPLYQQGAFRWNKIFMTSLPVLWFLILLPFLEANVLRVTLLQVFTDSTKVWDLPPMTLQSFLFGDNW